LDGHSGPQYPPDKVRCQAVERRIRLAVIEASDVALMSDDLSKLPWLVQHSRRAVSIIRQIITHSLAVKALFVILTFAGFASHWAAIAADMGVPQLVIFNALRLRGGPRH
jgi:Cd2+/Zn2+-exporting ATPase